MDETEEFEFRRRAEQEAAAPPAAPAAPAPESLMDKVYGAGEVAQSGIMNAVGQPLANVAGVIAHPLDAKAGAQAAERLGNELSTKYAPKTPAGQRYAGNVADWVDKSGLSALPPDLNVLGPVSAGVRGASQEVRGAAGEAKAVGDAAARTSRAEIAARPPAVSSAQQRALDTLRRFSKDPNAMQAPTTQILKGSKPTLAETTGDAGLAQLQRAQQSKSTNLGSELQARKDERMGVRQDTMEGVAGSEGELEYYKEAREAIAQPLYKKAYETPIDPKRLTPALRADITELMQRPAMQEARAEAIKKARNSGEQLSEQEMGSVKGLHWMKRAIDDKISEAKRAGNDDQARIYLGIQEKLLGAMQAVSPDYAKAMAEYQAASKPINRLQVGQYLKEKLFPSSNQYGGKGMTIGQFTKALEHPDQIAKLATGFSGAKLEKILSESEIKSLKDLAKDIIREQNVEAAGRISGSPTAQLTAAQGKLEKMLEKLEMVPSKFVKYPAKAAGWVVGKAKQSGDAEYESELNRMLMDPDYARAAAQKAANKAGIGGATP